MNKNDITYKIASQSDLKGLPAFLQSVFGNSFSIEELNWRYLKNPCQKKIYNCIALNEKNEIVGHTAFIKTPFVINKEKYFGGLTVGSAVNPNYAGIFVPLYLFLEKQISSSVDFLYGYPNDNSSPFFLKMFKYKLYPSKFFK